MQNMPGMDDMSGMDTKGADTRGLPPAAAPARPARPNGTPTGRPSTPR
jgi:hypothetical protein